LIGVTQLHCNERGQYRGSWFTEPLNAKGDISSDWQAAVDWALRAAERLQDRGYFGPLGIDAMRYTLPGGAVHMRPLQDINARWTMGRLSLGWRRLLRSGESGLWWHADPMTIDLDLRTHEMRGMQQVVMPLASDRMKQLSSWVILFKPAQEN
jgi:hypothetical protein